MSRLALLLVLTSLGQAPADEPKLVRDLLDRQVVDWNKGDLESFCEGYWKSPELVFQSGSSKSAGWQAMHDRYFKSYKSEGKAMGTLAFTDVEIQILAPDVAMARGRWGLTKLPDGKTPNGLFTLILRKFPGKTGWKIVHDHTSA